MATPNENPAPTKPMMAGCQQEPCSVSSIRAMRMECGKCGGFWVSPDNAQKLMDERDEARAERDKAQRIAIKSRGIIVGLERNVTTAAVKLVEFWEAQGGGNGVMARALEDALIQEVTAYKKTPDFTHSSQNGRHSIPPLAEGEECESLSSRLGREGKIEAGVTPVTPTAGRGDAEVCHQGREKRS